MGIMFVLFREEYIKLYDFVSQKKLRIKNTEDSFVSKSHLLLLVFFEINVSKWHVKKIYIFVVLWLVQQNDVVYAIREVVKCCEYET